jgi:anti-sigma regulatory factor (Ser/Thr protein kinase)
MANLSRAGCSFHHEALFYEGESSFLRGTLSFIREALATREPLLVAVSSARSSLLQEALEGEAEHVRFVDMHELGRNPARVIPAWGDFLRECAPGGSARGIGEPVWAGRSRAELSECQRHESLLNLAFADGPRWRLLCPYDLNALEDSVIQAARESHPFLDCQGASQSSDCYLDPASAPGPFDGLLPTTSAEVEELQFTASGLGAVRSLVSKRAREANLGEEANGDLVLAINELVTNSVQYGGGRGTLRIWKEGGELLCEVRDRGRIVDPLAGRVPPPLEQHGGRGLWLVNHLCDLVQIRASPAGNVVRTHMRLT